MPKWAEKSNPDADLETRIRQSAVGGKKKEARQLEPWISKPSDD